MQLLSEYPHVSKYDSIVMFATADWDNPFWTNKQHMACQLADAGFKVLYIESLGLRKVAIDKSDYARIFKRLLKFFKGARETRKNIWVFSPLVIPLHGNALSEFINRYLLVTSIRYFQWKYRFKKSLGWTYNPLVGSIFQQLKLSDVVYHSVDDLAAAPRLPKEEIEEKEKKLISLCSAVFVTSPTLLKKYSPYSICPIFYYPNVADYEHFAQAKKSETPLPADMNSFLGPKIGFIGAISSYKLDFNLISRAAQMTTDWKWILIGKVGEGDPTTDVTPLKRKNIFMIGPRPYEELPSYLKAFDVVVIPSPINDYTRSMFPMKFFEYLAAGKVIVSTDLPSLQDFKQAFLVASTPEEMVMQIDRVLKGEVRYDSRMELIAKENTWQKRLNRMLSDLDRSLEETAHVKKA